jgi:acetyltransferase-like isoleucine patch superfamily enzyme
METKPDNPSRQIIRKLYYRLAFWLVRRKIRGSGNEIHSRGAYLKHVTFDIQGNGNLIEVAPGASMKNVLFRIRGDHHRVRIGTGCRFNRGGVIWLEDDHGLLEIGAGTTIEEAHIAVTEPGRKISIGANCLLAYDIDIRSGDSHSLLDPTGKRINPAEDVIIADHVWIAAHVRILKGVRLARDIVVATGAVVVKPFETPGIILGGNPAKVIKENIGWSKERLPG